MLTQNFKRLIAIDPSLTCSGWALYNIENKSLIGVGKFKSLPPTYQMSIRLNNLQERIKELFRKLLLTKSDILICEAPTTMIDPKAAFKVEAVRGIFEVIARELNVFVPGRINSRTVHYEVMGLYGKQIERTLVKSAAVNTVKALYEKDLQKLKFETTLKNLARNQDIVDAILIGSLAVNKFHDSQRAKIHLSELLQRS